MMKNKLTDILFECMQLYGNTSPITVHISQALDEIIVKEQKQKSTQ